jgi:hypothetical protein
MIVEGDGWQCVWAQGSKQAVGGVEVFAATEAGTLRPPGVNVAALRSGKEGVDRESKLVCSGWTARRCRLVNAQLPFVPLQLPGHSNTILTLLSLHIQFAASVFFSSHS